MRGLLFSLVQQWATSEGERAFLWFIIPTIFTMDQMGYKKLAQQVHKGQT
jgi:hypothetical protein